MEIGVRSSCLLVPRGDINVGGIGVVASGTEEVGLYKSCSAEDDIIFGSFSWSSARFVTCKTPSKLNSTGFELLVFILESAKCNGVIKEEKEVSDINVKPIRPCLYSTCHY